MCSMMRGSEGVALLKWPLHGSRSSKTISRRDKNASRVRKMDFDRHPQLGGGVTG